MHDQDMSVSQLSFLPQMEEAMSMMSHVTGDTMIRPCLDPVLKRSACRILEYLKYYDSCPMLH